MDIIKDHKTMSLVVKEFQRRIFAGEDSNLKDVIRFIADQQNNTND